MSPSSFVCAQLIFSQFPPVKTQSDNDFQLTSLSSFRGLIALSHLISPPLKTLWDILLPLTWVEEKLLSEKDHRMRLSRIHFTLSAGLTRHTPPIISVRALRRSSSAEGQNGTRPPPSGEPRHVQGEPSGWPHGPSVRLKTQQTLELWCWENI